MTDISINRELFLSELRSGKHKKGTIQSDEKGSPVIKCQEDADGSCACAIATEMFGVTDKGKYSIKQAMSALGITTKECKYIQSEINDTPLDFKQIADRIETEVFKLSKSV